MSETRIMLQGFALGGGVLLAIKAILALLVFLILTFYPAEPVKAFQGRARAYSHNFRHVGSSHWHRHH